MKKIMHIVQSPGGVERYIQMLLKHIDTTKYENIMVCSRDYDAEYYKPYVTVFEHVDMGREISPVHDLKAVWAVRRLIKKYKPDIIYCHSSKAGAIGRAANFCINNKVVYNPHGWAFNMECGNQKRMLYRIVEHILAKMTDRIIAISDYEKESAIENHICKSEKLKVIYNGIDMAEYEKNIERFEISRPDLDIPENAYVIGFVGRLTKQKAPDVFIRAAAQIKQQIPQAYFLMVGNGEEQEQIMQLVTDSGLQDCVHITGWVDNPMEYVMLFDQAMLLSRWEGFGLVLAEYMWAGKPIVATQINAIPNLITDGVNGLLVEKDNVEEVSKAAIRIYKNKELAQRLCNNGKQIVAGRFSVERVVREHEKLFEEICPKDIVCSLGNDRQINDNKLAH